jgi:hypothetical protein
VRTGRRLSGGNGECVAETGTAAMVEGWGAGTAGATSNFFKNFNTNENDSHWLPWDALDRRGMQCIA